MRVLQPRAITPNTNTATLNPNRNQGQISAVVVLGEGRCAGAKCSATAQPCGITPTTIDRPVHASMTVSD